jgi:hypothetical protein
MGRDLPGQGMLFDEAPKAPAGALTGGVQDTRVPLALPRKPTCTPPEAAAALGVSERQVRYWVDDGTLLAINSARCPIGPVRGRQSKLDRWRIVVRRVPGATDSEAMKAFLTLEELVLKASNKEAS